MYIWSICHIFLLLGQVHRAPCGEAFEAFAIVVAMCVSRKKSNTDIVNLVTVK